MKKGHPIRVPFFSRDRLSLSDYWRPFNEMLKKYVKIY